MARRLRMAWRLGMGWLGMGMGRLGLGSRVGMGRLGMVGLARLGMGLGTVLGLVALLV
jgi:hypothetical protein